MRQLFLMALAALLMASTTKLHASEQIESYQEEDPAKYVSIHIEIKELAEAGAKLDKAANQLADAMNKVSENVQDLSPEQLQEIGKLTDKANLLSENLKAGIDAVPNAIENAKKPASELLTESLQQTRAETVDPILSAFQTWLLITIIGLVIVCIGLALALYFVMKGMKYLSEQIKAVTEGYRIVPVEQCELLFSAPRQDSQADTEWPVDKDLNHASKEFATGADPETKPESANQQTIDATGQKSQ